MRKYAVLALIVILALMMSGCALFSPAPPTKAILEGRVLVPEGAVCQVGGQPLPGATVRVKDLEGNIVATTTTDANGYYRVEVPPGGPYIIEAVKGSIKVLCVSPQVEAGKTYDLKTADATSTAVALVFQARVEAGEDPAEIDLEEIKKDPKFGNLAQAVEEALAAGEDPTTAPEVIRLVDVIVSPPKPAPAPAPAPTPTYAVTFKVTPADATVVVKDSKGNVVATTTPGVYKLTPGAYTYTVSKTGYVTQTGEFTVVDKALTITVNLITQEAAALAALKAGTKLDVTVEGNVVTATITYPTTIDSILNSWLADAKLEVDEALPAGTTVDITYNGTQVATDADVGGKTGAYLSELLSGDSRPPITAHANKEDVWVATITAEQTIDTTVTVKAVISKDNFTTEEVIAQDSAKLKILNIVIDGTLSLGEWDNYRWFTDNGGNAYFGGAPEFTYYKANDDQYLYIATIVNDPTPLGESNDDIWLAFRDANDNYKEFRKGFTTNPGEYGKYSEEPYTSSYLPLPTDVEFGWSTDASHIYYEWKIPLTLLNVSPGDTIKYLTHVREWSASVINYHPEVTSYSPYYDRNQFGDLTLD